MNGDVTANEAVLRSIRHEVWADLELLRYCETLTPEQLRWTVPGTYGAIHNTLHHIVGAQRGYLFRLTGQEDPAKDFTRETERLLPLSELVPQEERIGARLEAFLATPFAGGRLVPTRDGTATAGVVLAQLIHHGSDHRAHAGTILGAHGVTPPELDVWRYGIAIGEVKVSG
ncbi:MAG: DinB family protein [Chloroflexi bacterium]|nr:DinB family protein [Chloroflexota bacterium]